MMITRSRLVELFWILLAVGFLTVAGTLQPPLDEQSRIYEINPPQVAENHPAKMLLMMAPGGLRAPIVNYLWIRAEDLKQKGRHHEAMQLADIICKLQPGFVGVWNFHSWNMAYNISVMTHTPEERWLWVYNGVKLLRDEGIPQNRKGQKLYLQLAWLFHHKMGGYTDEMHMAYKRRWAFLMQRVLGAAPYETTDETIEAFRLIAEAPLDKDFRRQGKATIQKDQLAIVLSNEPVAIYADLLKAQGVEIGDGLLNTYNRYSHDLPVDVVRVYPPSLETEKDKTLSRLINSTEHAEARYKLLSFIRAQTLWNVYKMDPEWMLKLMEKYGPLDWRVVQSIGLYWSTYGVHVCEGRDLTNIDSLNTDRIVLFSLKALAWNGRLTYLENPEEPEWPRISWASDVRFIDSTHQEFILTGEANAKAQNRPFKYNEVQSGHVNFIIKSIQMLYASYRREEARELLEFLTDRYEMEGWPYDLDLDDLVIETLNKEGRPIPDRAYSQITSGLQTAFVQQARGNPRAHKESFAYARRVYNIYQKGAPTRLKLPDFRILVANSLANLLVRPAMMGINMSLIKRTELYSLADDRTQRMIYDVIAKTLREQCKSEGIDFGRAFPAPVGLEEYRRRQAAQ